MSIYIICLIWDRKDSDNPNLSGKHVFWAGNGKWQTDMSRAVQITDIQSLIEQFESAFKSVKERLDNRPYIQELLPTACTENIDDLMKNHALTKLSALERNLLGIK